MSEEKASHCLAQAAACRQYAMLQADPIDREDYLEFAERWARLAHSYEFAQELAQRIEELELTLCQQKAARSPPHSQWVSELLRRAQMLPPPRKGGNSRSVGARDAGAEH